MLVVPRGDSQYASGFGTTPGAKKAVLPANLRLSTAATPSAVSCRVQGQGREIAENVDAPPAPFLPPFPLPSTKKRAMQHKEPHRIHDS